VVRLISSCSLLIPVDSTVDVSTGSETENCGKPLTYEVSNRIVQKVFLPIESGEEVIRYVALHDSISLLPYLISDFLLTFLEPDVCSWGYQTLAEAHFHFLSYGQISCHHPTAVPNLNYLYIGLGLSLVFLVFFFHCLLHSASSFTLKVCRYCYQKN
jgi:hypothetical protein